MIKRINYDTDHADQFWKLQAYIAREYIQKKRFKDAYIVASSNFAVNPASRSDAEFLSGWLAVSFLNKPRKAMQHFRNFSQVVKTPISKARGVYWLARAYEASGDKANAKNLYNMGADKYSHAFYGQMCAMELGRSQLSLPRFSGLPRESSNSIAQAAKIVSKYGSAGLAQVYIKDAVRNASNVSNALGAVASVAKNKKLYHTTWASKYALQKNVFLDSYAYPAPYKVGHLPIEKALIYSIIRQESVFNQYAQSTANAKGLMQLMPGTARDTARKIGIAANTAKLTQDPVYNMKLGSNYLKLMIDEYHGSYIMAIAAYNAGPHNVNKWVKQFGDPRKMRNPRQVIDWMELIPFYETRNYVQRVIENLQIYRARIDRQKGFKLRKDLMQV